MSAELKIYKFINEEHNGIDYKWVTDDEVVCWVDFDNLEEFVRVFNITSMDALDVRLQESCVALDMSNVCDPLGVELCDIFEKD